MKTTYNYPYLDKNLDINERVEFVRHVCDTVPQEYLTPYYLTELSDYIIEGIPKKERLQHHIVTRNRQVTISKHETSYQGMAEKLEGGEDTLFNMFSDRGSEQYLAPKEKDPFPQSLIDQSPELQELRKTISEVEAAGSRLTRHLISMRQDQYVIRNSLVKPIHCTSLIRSFSHLDLDEDIKIKADGSGVVSTGICSVYNPKHVAAVLSNYENLKTYSYGKFTSDSWYFMMDFEKLFEQDFAAANPLYYDIARLKIMGYSNVEIQREIRKKHDKTFSLEYISTLWTKKIPAAIADLAAEQYIQWYYTFKEKGKYKKCNRCGQIKLALPRYFSKNSSSKDGFYSICKECRNKKKE